MTGGVRGGTRLTATAHCLAGCGWAVEGDVEHVEREARRHFGEAGLAGALSPGHSVSMTTTPVGGVPPKRGSADQHGDYQQRENDRG